MKIKRNVIIFLNVPVFKNADNYSAHYISLLDFFLESHDNFDQLTICLPVGRKGEGKVKFQIPKNVNILEIPFYWGPIDLFKKYPHVIICLLIILFKSRLKQYDLVGIVTPGLISLIVSPISYYLLKKRLFFIVRGDKKKSVRFRYKNQIFYQHVSIFLSAINDFLTFNLIGNRRSIYLSFLKNHVPHKKTSIHIYPLISKNIIKRRKISGFKNILFVGRLTYEKGIADLIKSFAMVKNSKPQSPISLHIVGGSDNDSLKPDTEYLKLSKNVGIENSTTFYGYVPYGDDLWSIFDRCNIFVLPSYTEGTPGVIFEAMSRGLAVIATTVGSIPDIITHGFNGLLVSPKNIEALKEAIELLIQDEKLRNSIIKEGYHTANKATFQLQAKEIMKFVEKKLF